MRNTHSLVINHDRSQKRTCMKNSLKNIVIDLDNPTVLYASDNHKVYWLGITDETAFRCNAYLIKDGEEAILVDPGSRAFFSQVRSRVEQIMDPGHITAMILCHQDPDVAASMVDWLEINPSMQVIATRRTHVLLPHHGQANYNALNIVETPYFTLPSGSHLQFIEAPFLHSPGAFVTYDKTSRYLFSGDIWAALDMKWNLVVESFEEHMQAMDLFHVDYMASNLAARGFTRRLTDIPIDAILSQHGSLIGKEHVNAAIDYLNRLQCGTDIIYADLAD